METEIIKKQLVLVKKASVITEKEVETMAKKTDLVHAISLLDACTCTGNCYSRL